jgi:DNA-binding CsgD family transcriptional regulator
MTWKKLSRQRTNILIGLANGLGHKELANAMGLRKATVNTHVRLAFADLGVHDRGHAVAIGFSRRILRPEHVILKGQCTARKDLVICRCDCGPCSRGEHLKHIERSLWNLPDQS